MAKPRIYVETSVISYLTARPSRDLLVAARQEWTRQWWESGRSACDAYASDLVVLEAQRGDLRASALRVEAVRQLKMLETTSDAQTLANRLIAERVVPAKEAEDALHIGIAVCARVHYLLTWNFAHLVWGPMRRQS
jgi:hypothetical protein